ncbi:MAG: GDSL-type esterase/lipase family protein [Planctomycetota bacterium]|nr:GDSL-type esterase/lipase family protein [Planctomycetota bacterium]
MTRRSLFILLSLVLGALVATWWLRDPAEDPEARAQRVRRAARDARLAAFAKETPAEGAVVFLGSSTIEFWPLAASFPGANTVNRGIGAEPVHELRERLATTVPPKPSGAVLYAGSVDFNTLGRPRVDVVRDVEALITDLRALLQDGTLAVIGVNAARDTTPGRAAQLAVLNAGIEAACREAQPPAFFVNTARPPLRTTEGRLNPAISRDRWHLNANGYAILSAWLREAAPNLDL